MTAKEYLSQLKELDIKIKQRHGQKEEIRETTASLRGISYDGVSVQSSNKKNPLEEYVIKLEKIDREINELLHEYFDKKNIIIGQIQGMNDANYIDLLEQRYVQHRSLNDIAKNMGYSDVWAYHTHLEALKVFEDMYSEYLKK